MGERTKKARGLQIGPVEATLVAIRVSPDPKSEGDSTSPKKPALDLRMKLRGSSIDDRDMQMLDSDLPEGEPLRLEHFLYVAICRSLKEQRDLIESNGHAAMEAVAICLRYGLQPEPWIADAFCNRLGKFQRYEVATLDEAFDVEKMKKKAVEAHRSHRALRPTVCAALLASMRANPDQAIDKVLFDEVGSQLGISSSHCEELYRAALSSGEVQSLQSYREILLLARGENPPKRRRSAGLRARR